MVGVFLRQALGIVTPCLDLGMDSRRKAAYLHRDILTGVVYLFYRNRETVRRKPQGRLHRTLRTQ